jgi:hypothetical protein
MSVLIWSGTTTFTAPSGSETIVPVKMPHRGILRGYALVQTNGGDNKFEADLYSSNQETEPNASLPAEAFHVLSLADFADVVADPDVVAIAENSNINVAYINRDGTPSNPQRYLYLWIKPNGSGSKNFVLTVTVETPGLR